MNNKRKEKGYCPFLPPYSNGMMPTITVPDIIGKQLAMASTYIASIEREI